MSIAEIEALYAAAVAALDSGDYAAAIIAATKAKLRLGTTPNLSRSLGGGNMSTTWNDATAVDKFIADCRALQKAAQAASTTSGGVFRQSAVRYQQAGS